MLLFGICYSVFGNSYPVFAVLYHVVVVRYSDPSSWSPLPPARTPKPPKSDREWVRSIVWMDLGISCRFHGKFHGLYHTIECSMGYIIPWGYPMRCLMVNPRNVEYCRAREGGSSRGSVFGVRFSVSANCYSVFGIQRCSGKQGMPRQGKARHDMARQGKARQGKARQGKARQGKARRARRSKCKAR